MLEEVSLQSESQTNCQMTRLPDAALTLKIACGPCDDLPGFASWPASGKLDQSLSSY